jgi:hypothetical protein
MAFNDIDTVWEYHQLIDKTRKIKPYKNSGQTPVYPLGNRRYSDRYFKPNLDARGEVLKQEILNNNEPWDIHDLPIDAYYNGKLGSFHPDNTFEFNPDATYFGQGETGVISSMLPGWVQSKAQCGGMIFTHRQTNNVVPVFQGLKIRLCDGTPVQDYEMHVNYLDKKLTKKYRQRHDSMFKMGSTMLKAMGTEGVLSELKQMVEGQVAPAINYNHEDLLKAFDPQDAAGAILWLTLRYNINECSWRLRRSSTGGAWWGQERFISSMSPNVLTANVKTHFYNEIYNAAIRDGDELRRSKVFKFGDKIPTVVWGYKIVVDGKIVKRIS